MDENTIGRAFATTVAGLILVAGTAGPVQADEPAPTCDVAALSNAVEGAKAEARAAQKAYTTHTRTAMRTLAQQLKAREAREARTAAKAADRLTAKAAKDPSLRAAAKAARVTAKAEAKEAAQVKRASAATLKRLVKAERTALKTSWDQAKARLAALRAQLEDCQEETEVVTPPAPA